MIRAHDLSTASATAGRRSRRRAPRCGRGGQYPDGWFAVAFADELRPGQVLRRRFMGEDVVVYRTSGGVLRAVEPYCPHLGAHLGYGGRVEGERSCARSTASRSTRAARACDRIRHGPPVARIAQREVRGQRRDPRVAPRRRRAARMGGRAAAHGGLPRFLPPGFCTRRPSAGHRRERRRHRAHRADPRVPRRASAAPVHAARPGLHDRLDDRTGDAAGRCALARSPSTSSCTTSPPLGRRDDPRLHAAAKFQLMATPINRAASAPLRRRAPRRIRPCGRRGRAAVSHLLTITLGPLFRRDTSVTSRSGNTRSTSTSRASAKGDGRCWRSVVGAAVLLAAGRDNGDRRRRSAPVADEAPTRAVEHRLKPQARRPRRRGGSPPFWRAPPPPAALPCPAR